MAALLNLKSSATLNKQICHIEVIATRYHKPRVPRCQICKRFNCGVEDYGTLKSPLHFLCVIKVI
jgi:hypothetical protein